MSKLLKALIIVVVIIVQVEPCYSKSIEIEYKEKIDKIDENISNIIVVYDKPIGLNKKHPEIMMDILDTLTHSIEDKYILHIPYNNVRVKSFQKIIEYIEEKKENINIYINISICPTMKINYSIFAKTIINLAKKKNVKITYATGNTYRIDQNLTKLDKNKNKLFDENIWKKLNQASKEIKRIGLIESVQSCKHDIGLWNEIICPKIWNYFNSSDLYDFIERKIRPTIIEFNIQNKDDVVNYYFETVNVFLFTGLLQSKKDNNVTFVSAHTPFSKKQVYKDGYLKSYQEYKDNIKGRIHKKDLAKYDNNYSLDCRIKGLVDYKKSENNVRNFGQYYNKKISDKNISGTSISAPIELAKIINRENK